MNARGIRTASLLLWVFAEGALLSAEGVSPCWEKYFDVPAKHGPCLSYHRKTRPMTSSVSFQRVQKHFF